MSTAVQARERLEAYSTELDQLSKTLTRITRELDGVDDNGNELPEDGIEKRYQDFIDNFEVGLYLQCEADGKRFPSEAMREKLARADMAAELLGRRDGLIRKSERIQKRISHVNRLIEAQRSIVSALKAELEAVPDGTYGGARRVA